MESLGANELTHLLLEPHILARELGQYWFREWLFTCSVPGHPWTNADFLSIGPLGTNCIEIPIKIQNFLLMEMHLEMASVKWWPFCLGGDELTPPAHTLDNCKIYISIFLADGLPLVFSFQATIFRSNSKFSEFSGTHFNSLRPSYAHIHQ